MSTSDTLLDRPAPLGAPSTDAGQKAFSDALQASVATFLGTRLDGAFSTVARPAGFHYGITYGPNAYWNVATLEEFDTMLCTRSGQLIFAEERFSTCYAQILGAASFVFSKQDEATMSAQDAAASAQIASILREFENDRGIYSNPLPFGGKLQDVFNQLIDAYGSLSNLPDSMNGLRNAIASYKARAAQSYALRNRWYQATDRLNAALANVLDPDTTNGGMEIAAGNFYAGYTPEQLPTANQLISGLQTTANAVSLTMTLSQFSSNAAQLSIAGSVGISVPILDLMKIGVQASASYDLSTFTSSSSNVTIAMTWTGVTLAPATPSVLSTDTTHGWYAPDILSEIIANVGKDVTGYQLQGSEFDPAAMFGPGKIFSRLKTFVISQPPTVQMTISAAQLAAVTSNLKVGAKVDLDLFGLFTLGSASANYAVQKIDTSQATGTVTVTFGPPQVSGTTPLEQQLAYVMGGVASYPPTTV